VELFSFIKIGSEKLNGFTAGFGLKKSRNAIICHPFTSIDAFTLIGHIVFYTNYTID